MSSVMDSTMELQFDIDVNSDLKDRMINEGADSLSNYQLLRLIVGAPAKKVLNYFDETTFHPEYEELMKIRGVGKSTAAMLIALVELSRRYRAPKNHRIRFPADAYPLVSHYADRPQEHFISILLNGAHEVIDLEVVSIGLVNRTLVHPREVFAPAIEKRATAVVVAHNHPSGKTDPSAEDHEVTKRLSAAAETIGIRLLDHIVFSTDGYYSFLEHGEM